MLEWEDRRELALEFANVLTLDSLHDLLAGCYGAEFAASFEFWQRENCWVAAANCEPIMVQCQMGVEFDDLIEATAGAETEAKPVAVSIEAYNGGQMTLPGYKYPVVVDIRGVDGLNRAIPILRDHSPQRIVGHGVARAEGFSLYVKGQLLTSGADVEQLVKAAREGFPWQASIGLQPYSFAMVREGEAQFVNGTNVAGPVLIARTGLLREVSIVPIGADATTQTKLAASVADVDTIEADVSQEIAAQFSAPDSDELAIVEEIQAMAERRSIERMENLLAYYRAKEQGRLFGGESWE